MAKDFKVSIYVYIFDLKCTTLNLTEGYSLDFVPAVLRIGVSKFVISFKYNCEKRSTPQESSTGK